MTKDYYDDFNAKQSDVAYDIVGEEAGQPKCGALGDCLGWNNPHNHEAVKRNQLIRRVMLIVFAQLVVVSIMCSIVLFVPFIRDYIQDNNTYNSWFFWTAFIIAFVFEIGSFLALFVVRKKFPVNLVVLFIFTLSTGYFVAITVSMYALSVVLEAVIICAVVVITIVLYTLISKADFKFLGPALFLSLLCFVIWGNFWFLLWIFGYEAYWLYQIFCLFGVIIFILYLLFDMSRLVNNHPPDEYILAAVSLYLDIINLFLLILAVFGGGRR